MAEAIVHLSGAIDENGAAIHPDVILPPSSARTADIAPWMDDSQSPPPKSSRFGFSPKPSLSFISLRPSTSSTASRPSDPRSFEHRWPSSSNDDHDSILDDPYDTPGPRKSKSSLFSLSRLKSRSKSRIRLDSASSTQIPVPPLPDYHMAASLSRITLAPSHSTVHLGKEKKEKKENKLTRKLRSVASTPKTPKEGSDELKLDTNLDSMEGIIDPTYVASGIPPNFGPSSPTSAFDSSSQSYSHSDHSSFRHQHILAPSTSRISSAEFSNPFLPGSVSDLRKNALPQGDFRRVSPKTLLPPLNYGVSPRRQSLHGSDNPSWTPPQSWAVHRDGVDKEEGDYTSSDDGVEFPKKAARRHKSSVGKLPGKVDQPFKLRIYRASGKYHIVSTNYHVDVASLLPALKDRLLGSTERETYRLYLREHSRERLLGSHERPAEIVRRRLEQAGYEPDDIGQIITNENMNFLVKFIYKSQRLGPIEDDFFFDKLDNVNLTNRSLRTIPVKLHQSAEQIVRLVLSCNPMLEIPLDFIQSCTNLRDLHLSNMSMKRVPQSVRHAASLIRLDLSANRLSDLSEAFLDNIPSLQMLDIHNNRLESLPWYFPRMHSLTKLNVANNRLKKFPHVLLGMENLIQLDVSFNNLDELPNDISRLRSLIELKITGNQIPRLPPSLAELRHLETLDCARNQIVDIGVACELPSLTLLRAAYNCISSLRLSLGPRLKTLDVSHNDITHISLHPSLQSPRSLIELNLSHAKLSSIDDATLGSLISLQTLRIDHNTFTSLPETLCQLRHLTHLICSDNKLTALPESIGQLDCLRELAAHNNSLTDLPVSIWNCASLETLNLTSNLLGNWHDPPVVRRDSEVDSDSRYSRKGSVVSLTSVPVLPPLAHSLKRLYLGENRLIDEVLHVLMIFKELRILNLSFNEFQDMPSNFFTNLNLLEELYLSGNKLTSLPTEDLPRLQYLKRLCLNGNKLQTLPQELGKVKSLTVLDVGTNLLRYNITNWEFDWNWNFNKGLKYLNLSGNKRLQIRSDAALKSAVSRTHARDLAMLGLQSLSGFTELSHLCVLGLMDVTMTTTGNLWMDIPDENEDRRVRTSSSIVNGMAYGIADTLGRDDRLTLIDLAHEFRGQSGEAIFAIFGLAELGKPVLPEVNPNCVAKFLRDRFVAIFVLQLNQLNKKKEGIPDALRRAFLRLNQELYDGLTQMANGGRRMSHVSSCSAVGTDNPYLQTGAVGIVLYFVGKTLYVANVGDTLAVVSRQGSALLSSKKHTPFDYDEMERIRAAGGWVSSDGKVNQEIDTSRAFGFYNHMPIVNSRPDITVVELTLTDEFVIVANRSLWDFVSYQTAVDIARMEPDPTMASQKLRDLAMSYGAEGSIMIMVIGVKDLFGPEIKAESAFNIPRKVKGGIQDRDIARLDGEVTAPTGHLALVFTDIRNSTHLWEVNPGMPTAMRLHNSLLRRQLRLCGGYEVKTEGDAFMCSFPTTLAAVWWCLTVQDQLLHESWPLEILECDDGRPQYDLQGQLIARGLSVRMGIHCGMPVCERDPNTQRMDYFGPVVNRSARISGNAQGGHIMCSSDVIREINASVVGTEPETEHSKLQLPAAIESIRRMGIFTKQVGEVKLKGLEVPELLTLIYPSHLQGRAEDKPPAPPTTSTSRVQLNWEQVRDLGMLCLRLEALSANRVFKSSSSQEARPSNPKPEDKTEAGGKNEKESEFGKDENKDERIPKISTKYFIGDPTLLLPNVSEKSTDEQLMMVLDSISLRIANAERGITEDREKRSSISELSLEVQFQEALRNRGRLDQRTLEMLLNVLKTP